jgi:DMSO/TMAO reductase YedYZ molybdopterin-dependent catalytic subunit
MNRMDTTELRSAVAAFLPTALVGLFAGGAAVAGSYAVAGFTPSFVVAPVSGILSRQLPDVVIRYAITLLGSLGQQLNLLTAIALVVTAIAALAIVGRYAGRELNNRAVPVVLTTIGAWIVAAGLTGNLTLAFAAAIPAGAVVLLGELSMDVPVGDSLSEGRRQVVASGISVLGIGAVGYVLGNRRTPSSTGTLGDTTSLGNSTSASAASTRGNSTGGSGGSDGPSRRQQLLNDAGSKAFDLPDSDPLVSEDFYNVDINAVDPSVDESSWTLSVTGEVEQEVEIDYEQLRSMPSLDRFETLRCVGERLNGHKMDTALWTGVPIMDVIEQANPQSDCECVMFRSADDYFEEFPMAALEDGMIAYGMNGRVLPRAHGFPARALIPGHWGEINNKWITEIEILDEEMDGYWEQRGWHGTGPVNTVAKLHSHGRRDGTRFVGGHAYAGTRGIQRVEVSIDGGSTWNEAELTEPLEPAIDAWRQWRYEYDPPGGSHEVVVRATDGTGTLQPQEETGAFPSGPSGWVSKELG